jgi:class 3 adenylate cyclase
MADKPEHAEKKTEGSTNLASERLDAGVVSLDPLRYATTSVLPSTVSDILTRVNSFTVSSGVSAIPESAYRLTTDYSALGTLGGLVVDRGLTSKHRELESEITALKKTLEERARALNVEKTSAHENKKRIKALETTLQELQAKEQLGFLLNRVSPEAQRALLERDEFRELFLSSRECRAFVMSVDIRRSTELMLKARTAEDFAQFTTTLCGDLMNIVLDSLGVFDKFTGDGVLAFFPDFYSGTDAAFRVVQAADRCHEAFKRHYHAFRRSFTSILTDVGLGIGVDFGSVHLVQMAGGITVVGAPVVYACRLSGAPPGTTLVNQPAYEVISDRFGAFCFTSETSLEIKHEGRMLAYEVRLNGRPHAIAAPEWAAPSSKPDSAEKNSAV